MHRRARSHSAPASIGAPTTSDTPPLISSHVPRIHHKPTGRQVYVQNHGHVDGSVPVVDFQDTSGDQSICKRCLKWSLLTQYSYPLVSQSHDFDMINSRKVKKWGRPIDMRTSRCALCRLFALHAYDYGVNPMEFRMYALHEIGCRVGHGSLETSGHNGSGSSFWFLDPTTEARAGYPALMGAGACVGRICPDLEVLAPVQINADAVDFDRIREWLAFCRRDHKLSCDPVSTDTLPAITLLDCVSIPPRLVPLHHRKYAALSYVWGIPGAVGSYEVGDTVEESTIPNTIRDAMVVASKLGLYLWVDRYCISQDPDIKREQISKMDIIYAGAEITIIATAGKDIEYGLPGVTQRCRAQQPFVRVGRDKFVSTYGDIGKTIEASQWWQRAWCFQEALLSRRRLYFTDGQMYFQCRRTACLEVLSHPFEYPHKMPQSITALQPKGFYDLLQVMNSPDLDPDTIQLIVSTYSGKHMSFESDGLNAVAGILRSMLKLDLKTQFNSYAGLTIFGGPSTTAFITALFWNGFSQRRRSDPYLPSWSWTGWDGSNQPVDIDKPAERIDKDIRLRLINPDGSEIPWDDFAKSAKLHETVFPLSRFIELHVLTDMVNVVWKASPRWQWGGRYAIPIQHFPSGGIRYAYISMNHIDASSGKLAPELHEEVLSLQSKCILLLPWDHDKKTSGQAMLLRRVEDYYERMGLLALNFVGDIVDADGNMERFVMSTDQDTAIEGFNFRREWIRLG